MVRVDEREFTARLRGASTQALTPLRACQRRLHELMGLLPGDPAPATGQWMAVLDHEERLPVAAYLPGRDTILVYFNAPIALTHEWLHGLEDQYGDRLAKIRTATTTDERMALRATSEGFATSRSGGTPERPVATPNLDGTMLRLVYAIGGPFFDARPRHWTEDLTFSPTSTLELLGGEPAQRTPGYATETGCTDRLGVAGLLTLGARLGVGTNAPLQFAGLWVTDSASLVFGGPPTWSWTIELLDAPMSRRFRDAVAQNGPSGVQVSLVSPTDTVP